MECCILYIQKGCSSYLIIILYIVFLFFYYNTNFITAYLFFFQVKWQHYSAETLQDIAQSVTDSSRNNHNIPQLVHDEGCPVKFYDWKTFLKQFFKPLSSLITYHHFRADKESPRMVFVRVLQLFGKGIQVAKETSSYILVYAI